MNALRLFPQLLQEQQGGCAITNDFRIDLDHSLHYSAECWRSALIGLYVYE